MEGQESKLIAVSTVLLALFAANDLADSALIEAVSAIKRTPYYSEKSCVRNLNRALKESHRSQAAMRFFLHERGSWDTAAEYLDQVADEVRHDATILMYTMKSFLDKAHEGHSEARAKVMLAECILDIAVSMQTSAMDAFRRIGVAREEIIVMSSFGMGKTFRWFAEAENTILKSDTGKKYEVMDDKQCALAYKILLQNISNFERSKDFLKGDDGAS